MSHSTDLRQQRAKLIADARTVIDSNETLDAEQRGQVDTMLNDADTLKSDIDRVEAIEAEERDIEQASDRRTQIEQPEVVEDRSLAPSTSTPEYRDAFDQYIRVGRVGLSQPERRALEAGVAAEGGYLTPTVLSDSANLQGTIIETIDNDAPFMGLATVVNVTGDITIPTESSTGAAAWTLEEGTYNDSDAAFGQVTLTPHKATTMIKVSEELLADNAVNLEAYLGRNFGRRFSNLLNAAFTVGTGSNQPTSVGALSTSAGTTGSSGMVTMDELMTLYYAPKEAYRRAGTWMMNTASAKGIRQLKDGNDHYLWEPSVRAGEPDTLFGRPVAINDDCLDMATTTKSVYFGDFSYYWVAMSQGVSLRRVDELYAATGQVGLLASVRCDGELTLAESVYHLVQD